jgi:hypothetical protein
MRRWVPILSAAVALAAMLGLPSRWVLYGECCYGEGQIPGVSCCGRPELDPSQANLTRHRDCCAPKVFEAARLDVVAVSPLHAFAWDLSVHAGSMEPILRVSKLTHEVLPNLSLTGPPPDRPPLYLFLERFLI